MIRIGFIILEKENAPVTTAGSCLLGCCRQTSIRVQVLDPFFLRKNIHDLVQHKVSKCPSPTSDDLTQVIKLKKTNKGFLLLLLWLNMWSIKLTTPSLLVGAFRTKEQIHHHLLPFLRLGWVSFTWRLKRLMLQIVPLVLCAQVTLEC